MVVLRKLQHDFTEIDFTFSLTLKNFTKLILTQQSFHSSQNIYVVKIVIILRFSCFFTFFLDKHTLRIDNTHEKKKSK